MKLKLMAFCNKLAVISLALYLSSFTMIENRPAGKKNDRSASFYTGRDTIAPNSEIESSTPVTLRECPFTKDEVFISPGERANWDYNNILKCTFVTTSVEGYFVKSTNDNLKTLLILYNPAGQKKLKMVITGTRVDNSNIRYQYSSVDGVMSFDITIRDNSQGYNVNIGTPLDFRPLGQNLVKQANKTTTGGGCSRTSGFRSCITCSARECIDTWWCVIACVAAPEVCVAAWIVACTALNINP